MQQPSLIARDETVLGVCAGLGEDLGFNPVWLRIALAAGLLWNPQAIVGAYLALGLLVLFSRLVSPNPRVRTAVPAEPAAAEPEPLAIAA